MSTSVLLDGETQWQVLSGQPICVDGWLQSAYAIPFDASSVDPALLAQFFGLGFTTFIIPFFSAWGVIQLVRVVGR